MYKIYRLAAEQERGSGRSLDQPVVAKVRDQGSTPLTVVGVREVQQRKSGGELVGRQWAVDFLGAFDSKHSEVWDSDLFSDFCSEFHGVHDPLDLIGLKFHAVMGKSEGFSVCRDANGQFTIVSEPDGQAYEEGPWETFSEAEQAALSAGLKHTQPQIERVSIDESDLNHNRTRLGIA